MNYMEDIETYLNTLTESTKKTYERYLYDLINRYNNADFKTVNPQLLLDFVIETYDSNSQQQSALSAISGFLRHVNHKDLVFNKSKSKLVIPLLAEYNLQLSKTQKESIPIVKPDFPKSDVLKQIWEDLPENNVEDLRDKIILDFCINYPMLRGDGCYFRRENYDGKSLYIPKRVKINKDLTIELKEHTIDMLNRYLEMHTSPFLFDFPNWKVSREEINTGATCNYTKHVNRMSYEKLGYKISVNDYRKLFIENEEEKIKDLPRREQQKQRLETCEKQGHSIETRTVHYDVFERDESESGIDEDLLKPEIEKATIETQTDIGYDREMELIKLQIRNKELDIEILKLEIEKMKLMKM